MTGDGYYAPDACKICHAAPGTPHEDFCPVPVDEFFAPGPLRSLWDALTPFGRAVFIAVPLIAVGACLGLAYTLWRGAAAIIGGC